MTPRSPFGLSTITPPITANIEKKPARQFLIETNLRESEAISINLGPQTERQRTTDGSIQHMIEHTADSIFNDQSVHVKPEGRQEVVIIEETPVKDEAYKLEDDEEESIKGSVKEEIKLPEIVPKLQSVKSEENSPK